MSPALRLACSLVASLLLWLPTVPAALEVHEDPARIALRYLGCLLVSRIGVGLLFRIVNGYAATAADQQADEPADAADEAGTVLPFGRRREDEAMPADDTPEDELFDEAPDDVRDADAMVS